MLSDDHALHVFSLCVIRTLIYLLKSLAKREDSVFVTRYLRTSCLCRLYFAPHLMTGIENKCVMAVSSCTSCEKWYYKMIRMTFLFFIHTFSRHLSVNTFSHIQTRLNRHGQIQNNIKVGKQNNRCVVRHVIHSYMVRLNSLLSTESWVLR
jgi:hypothetical protein